MAMLSELDDEGVLLITLNRPERKNAFDEDQWDALSEALCAARENPAVAVVVLTGAGGNFSSGADLASFGGSGDRAPRTDGFASGFFACANAIHAFDKPLLAAVAGVAVGGGATIAVACDVVYVAESLRMRMPFANLALVPEIASSYTLQNAIGRQRAAEIMFTAEWIDHDRAVSLGLAARSFPDDELLDQVMAKAHEMSQWSVTALQAIKQTLMEPHRAPVAAAIEIEDRLMAERQGSPENIEAIMAFMEKRSPDFKQFRKASE